MKVSKIFSGQVSGLNGAIINVEMDVAMGIYSFIIVGLPDQSVAESKERVHSALKNSGFDSPKSRNHKITVSLSPAEIRKEGPVFDLAIAVSYLYSAGDIENKDNILSESIFIGELNLSGELQSIRGVLPIAIAAKKEGFKNIFLPIQNAQEASLIEGIKVYGAKNIKEVIEHIQGKNTIIETKYEVKADFENKYPDMSEIRGQTLAKRALMIAAAGGHNICLYGPPGTGKTMMAKAFTGILPTLSFEDSLEVTSIHSVAGSKLVIENKIIKHPPLRSPHHTSSYVSIVGGGSVPKPGEITLAHKGVLFLDEFPEFESKTLEAMREPLEDNIIRISRARGSEIFPADFILLAAMNPCPCGFLGSKVKECICKTNEIERYQKRISGPIMDRIDLWVFVQNVNYEELSKQVDNNHVSDEMRTKVQQVRTHSAKRNKLNRSLSPKDLETYAKLDTDTRDTLNNLAANLNISPRVYHRLIRVARTIADLDNQENIKKEHILEAFQYRPKMNV